MPRPRIDRYWQERIRELTQQNPGLGSSKMAAMLEEEAKRLGRSDWPSEKAVRNYMALHREAPEHERRQYGLVFWPESFGKPELPWEAAPFALEAIRLCGEKDRPTVRTAKWFWRITLGCPEADAKERLDWARKVAAAEASDLPGVRETMRHIEWRLLHPGMMPTEPWRIHASIDAATTEGIFSPSFAEQLKESRRQAKEREATDER